MEDLLVQAETPADSPVAAAQWVYQQFTQTQAKWLLLRLINEQNLENAAINVGEGQKREAVLESLVDFDIPDMEEMDKYQVVGIVDTKEYRIINLDISLHPEGPEEPWTTEITEPEFEKQYIGLTLEEIDLSPDGKIDAITDATLSSTWITDAIQEKVSELLKRVRG